MIRLPWYAWVIAALLCWPTVVFSESYSLTRETDKLTLTQEPCLQHEWLKKWKRANWVYLGKPYTACWQPQSDGQTVRIVVLDSEGVVSVFDPRSFKQDLGV